MSYSTSGPKQLLLLSITFQVHFHEPTSPSGPKLLRFHAFFLNFIAHTGIQRFHASNSTFGLNLYSHVFTSFWDSITFAFLPMTQHHGPKQLCAPYVMPSMTFKARAPVSPSGPKLLRSLALPLIHYLIVVAFCV